MASRIRIFNHFAKPLAEIVAPTTPRSWILNGYGRCEFSMSTSDPKCTETIMQFGNLVHVEHIPTRDADGNYNGKLPDWTGIIMTPRTWDYGVLHVTAYSAESILAFRAMPFVTVSGTPMTLFKRILDYAALKAKNIVIQPGTLDDVNMTIPDDLRTNAYDHIQKMIKDSGMDWNVEGRVNDNGSLDLFANLYYRKGVDTSLDLNNSNTELQSPLLTEQGTPSNHIFGYSQAQTSQSRVMSEILNQESIDDYGDLQINQVFMGKHDKASVTNAAQSRADTRGRPVKIIKRVALDKGSTFNYLDVGNTVKVKEISVGFNPDGGFGFESTVKIISMDYNDLSNKTPLNVEVMNG